MYTDRATEYIVEKGCYCSLADCEGYSLVIVYIFIFNSILDGSSDNGSLTVLDSCRLGAPNGTAHTMSGLVYRPDPNQQGKLIAKLDGFRTLNCT